MANWNKNPNFSVAFAIDIFLRGSPNYTLLQNKRWTKVVWGGPPTNNFRRTKLTQQTIYHWKENLMVGAIHLKYWKNFLISRLFLSNFHELTSQWLQKKIQNFKEIIYIYIQLLTHVIWRFWICNYFCEISKFRDSMNTESNFEKSVFAHNATSYCGAIAESFRKNLLIKSRNQYILSISKMKWTLQ